MKTGEGLYSKVYQTPRLPRAALTPNLPHGRQDISNPEAKTSVDHQSKRSEETRRTHLEETRRAKYEETRSGNVDYRIQGIPHSAVHKEDSNRKEIAQRLIHQFEFSEKSKELITGIGHTEYLDLCEISSEIQCLDVLYTGKLASYTAPATNACNRRKGFDS